jgi:hypothetical protein
VTAFAFLGGRSSEAAWSRPTPPISLMSLHFPFYLRRLSAPFTIFHFPLSARPGGQDSPRRRGVAPADCSPVGSTARTDDSSLQPDILAVPSCPRGFDLVTGVTSRSTVSHGHCSLHPLSLCRYSNEIDCLARACTEPMFDNRYSSEHYHGHRVPSSGQSRHRQRLTPSALFVSLLKPSVDVLRQYSLPNMDLRRATYLTIALLPNHETTSVDVSFNVPVRPPFRRCLVRAQRPPAPQSPVPFDSPGATSSSQ